MEKKTDETEILNWFEKTEFEGSILLQFDLNRDRKTVRLVTSFPMGSNPERNRDFHYKFRLTEFGGVNSVNRQVPNPNNTLSFTDSYLVDKKSKGAVELNWFQLKTYPSNYSIFLDFGNNYGSCEFEFNAVSYALRKGQIITRNRKKCILDTDSKTTIDFYTPFE